MSGLEDLYPFLGEVPADAGPILAEVRASTLEKSREVSALRRAGFGADLAPMTGHGYREAGRVLAGEWSVDRAIEVTARHTRQYAKRQLSWLRRDTRIVWLDAGDRAAGDPALVGRALDLLERLLAG